MIDTTVAAPWYIVLAIAVTAAGVILNWDRGRHRASVHLWMGRGLRVDEPAVRFQIHNSGGCPLAPCVFVAVTGSVFRRHRKPLVGFAVNPPLAPAATMSDYFADWTLSSLDDVRSLELVDASGRRYRVLRRELRQVQQRCREIRANPRFVDGMIRIKPTIVGRTLPPDTPNGSTPDASA